MSEAPISRRRAETQARLLDAAIGIFAERGVLAATVEEISDRAGFTRGAFYSNFATKDDLCIEIARHVAEATAARFRVADPAAVAATLTALADAVEG